MRIGVYGGSFDPPHVGHAMVAAWLGWSGRVDEVWLLPTYKHAFGKRLAPFTLRCELCEALANMVGPWVRVEQIEATLDPPSFTIHTLTALQAEHPEHTFHLVVGSDVLPDVPRWKDWSRIAEEFTPIIVGRAGHADVDGVPTFPQVSSTQVRDRLRARLDVESLVPRPIAQLIPPNLYDLINSPTRS